LSLVSLTLNVKGALFPGGSRSVDGKATNHCRAKQDFVLRERPSGYHTQSRLVDDRKIRMVLDRFKHLEHKHSEKVELLMRELGASPGFRHQASTTGGGLLGRALGAIGVDNMLKADPVIERKAVEGYSKLIASLHDTSIADRLAENMIDASLMHLWIKQELRNLGVGWKRSGFRSATAE